MTGFLDWVIVGMVGLPVLTSVPIFWNWISFQFACILLKKKKRNIQTVINCLASCYVLYIILQEQLSQHDDLSFTRIQKDKFEYLSRTLLLLYELR